MTFDLNDMYVQKWLTGLSDKTKAEYPKLIGDWFNFLGMTPSEIINKRSHDQLNPDLLVQNFFENKWREYKQYLESTGTNSDSKVHDRLKVASSFFSRNFGNGKGLSLVKGDWKSTQKQLVKEKKEKLTLEDVKRLYAKADLRDKCILLILAQSGFSEIDISLLKIEDINGLYNLAINEHYVIEKGREKTTIVQATCLSYEFLHDLRLALEEKGNPTHGYIFTSQTKEKGIEPISTKRINEIIKKLYERTFTPERAKKLTARSLRSFYNGALLAVKPSLNPEIKDLLMGHDRIGAKNNYQYNDETIRESYIAAFEYLSINGLQSRSDIAKIKEDMNTIIGKQQVQIEGMKEDHKKEMEEQNKKIEELTSFLRDLSKDIKDVKQATKDAMIIASKQEKQQ